MLITQSGFYKELLVISYFKSQKKQMLIVKIKKKKQDLRRKPREQW